MNLVGPLFKGFWGSVSDLAQSEDIGVADGARTHDNRNHNPGLYQLSYSHRSAHNYSGSLARLREAPVIGSPRWRPRLLAARLV